MFTFCPGCLDTETGEPKTHCRRCGVALQSLFDEDGAMTREYLLARGACCEADCRNCPYRHASPIKEPLAKPARKRVKGPRP